MQDPGVYRIMLKWSSQKENGALSSGFIWLRKGTSNRVMSLGVPESAGIILSGAAAIVFSRATINPSTSRPTARPDSAVETRQCCPRNTTQHNGAINAALSADVLTIQPHKWTTGDRQNPI